MSVPVKAMVMYSAVPFLTASGTWFSFRSSPLLVFVSALGAWLCYSKSHEILTGDFVHSEDLGDDLAEMNVSYGLISAGILVSLAAFPLCVYGVYLENLGLLCAGYLAFFFGHAVIHKARFDTFI